MTSPTEQAPAAGVEAVKLVERLGRFAGAARVTVYNGSAGQLLMTAGALAAEAAVTIADLEARLRTARADALEDAGAAAWWATYNAAFGYNGATVCDEIADAARDAIRALNPPEKPHDAS